MKKRVVLTGIGLRTPLGNTPNCFFSAAIAGQSGISRIKKFDVSRFAVQIGGEIQKEASEPLPKYSNVIKWSMDAACDAIKDASLSLESEDPTEISVVLGGGSPDLRLIECYALEQQVNGPTTGQIESAVQMNPAAAAVHISAKFGIRGEVVNISTACSSSLNAIGYAVRLIQNGDATCVLSGGVDEGLNAFYLSTFGNSCVLSKRNDDPKHASRPFDAGRDGYILSDAACILVLEEYEKAARRGAQIYCELAGFGASSDACSPLKVDKSEESSVRAVEKSLKSGGISTREVDYYCAHGSSSRWTDIRETRMLRRVFREDAIKLNVSSIKSMMGHPLGAAGAVQAATCALAIRHGAIPPTINYEKPDPECDLNYVPNCARAQHVRHALCYSLGNGGNNAALALSAC
jgi:3-oxoacyl-[acyl-carrier-protein] synthase II